MSGERFLVSLEEVTNSENVLTMNSIVKENVNFWEEDIFINNDLKETVLKIEKDILTIKTDMKLNHVKKANK